MKVQDRIENYLVKQYDDRKHDRSGHYPSEANMCARQLWYRWKNVPESDKPYPTALIKMEIGNGIHMQVAEWLRGSGLELTEEIPFKHVDARLKYPISGRIDIVYLDNGIQKAIEVKSSFGAGIDSIIKSGKPKSEHILQCALYLFCSKLEEITLIYIARDKAKCVEFNIEKRENKIYCEKILQDFTFDSIIEKFRDLEEKLASENIPARPFRLAYWFNPKLNKCVATDGFTCKGDSYDGDWQCNYCSHQNHCWKDCFEQCNALGEGKYLGEKRIV